MAENDLTIRLKALDGQWETVGAERLRGIVPENFQATANEWGSDTCSFVLRRTTGAVHPDLTAFTPCRVAVAGVKVWSGRVKETPTQDGTDEQIVVQGEGMQYHLDDDVYDRKYVHTRLADWQDYRSYVAANLTSFTAGYEVSGGDGVITLKIPSGYTAPTSTAGGVWLDFGDTGAAQITVTWTGGGANVRFLLRAGDTPLADDEVFVLDAAPLNTTSVTTTTTFASTRRYLGLEINNNGVGVAGGDSAYVRITAVQVFAETAYASAGVSVLTADDVVTDAVDRATLLLSSDRTQVQAGTFVIDDYALSGARSPREAISGINAYENYDTKVDVEDRMCFRARPTAPIYEIGEWAGADFADASANSGDDIFNRVLVQGSGPDGASLAVSRASGELASAVPLVAPVTTPVLTNASADLNATGWTGTAYTVSRDTTTVHTAPGSINWHSATFIGSGQRLVTTFTAGSTFRSGVTYVLGVWLRAGSAGKVRLRFGKDADGFISDFDEPLYDFGVTGVDPIPTAAFTPYQIFWTPDTTYDSSTVTLTVFTGDNGTFPTDIWVDTLALFRASATLPDRRGFVRTKILPISSSITRATGQRLGDLYLTAHQTTPFRGGFKVTGRGGVRRVLGGGSVHPAWLLRDTGQLVRCSHRGDPDNGSWTRSGRMATVSYDHDSQTSTVALDEDREGFEALLARLALVTG